MYKFEQLGWDGCRREVSDKEFTEVEVRLGVILPEDYKECIKVCNGGYLKRCNFTFIDQKYGNTGGCLGALLSFDMDDPENILDTSLDLAEQLPAKLVPFADDGGGDFMCFDYNSADSPDAPKVVYRHHERHGDDSVTYLCNSFTEFIGMLHD